MTGWALDLGTTNSGIARWDEATGQPQLVELPEVCRHPERDDPLEAPRMVPSAVHILETPGLLDRLGSWPPVASRLFISLVSPDPGSTRSPGVPRNDTAKARPLRHCARVGPP